MADLARAIVSGFQVGQDLAAQVEKNRRLRIDHNHQMRARRIGGQLQERFERNMASVAMLRDELGDIDYGNDEQYHEARRRIDDALRFAMLDSFNAAQTAMMSDPGNPYVAESAQAVFGALGAMVESINRTTGAIEAENIRAQGELEASKEYTRGRVKAAEIGAESDRKLTEMREAGDDRRAAMAYSGDVLRSQSALEAARIREEGDVDLQKRDAWWDAFNSVNEALLDPEIGDDPVREEQAIQLKELLLDQGGNAGYVDEETVRRHREIMDKARDRRALADGAEPDEEGKVPRRPLSLEETEQLGEAHRQAVEKFVTEAAGSTVMGIQKGGAYLRGLTGGYQPGPQGEGSVYPPGGGLSQERIREIAEERGLY